MIEMKENGSNQERTGNPGIFDFRIMSSSELTDKLNALRRCEPNMVSPSEAGVTLEALRKSGITGGKDAYFLVKQKYALGVIQELGEPSNFNEVLADIIEQG